jgi:DNA excision repair protein ERCC-6
MEQTTEDYENKVLLENLESNKDKKLEKLKRKYDDSEDIKSRNKLKEEMDSIQREYEKSKNEILVQVEQNICGETELEDMNLETNFFNEFGFDFRRNFSLKYKIKEEEIENYILKNSYTVIGFNIPKEIWDSLFDYQKTGVKWMLNLYKNEMGGILADDMGLGKTVQTISYLGILLFNKKIKNGVVLCPVTVKEQWIREWYKIYPFIEFKEVIGEGIHIMSYEKFKELKYIEWDILILDEGHKIKNPNTKIAKHLRSFKIKNKLVLTGTPIQNNLGELWSLMNFVNPGLLGPYSNFKEEFEIPISQGGYQRASKSKQDIAYKYSLVLKGLVDPFILRRLKQQIDLKLPSKIDRIYFCSLTERQSILYKQTVESDFIGKVISGDISLFSGIDVLRKICNHPDLIYKKKFCNGELNDDNEKKDDISYLINVSSKMIVLHQMLFKWKITNEKVLIFSQRVKMLDIIEKTLQNYKYLRMDGETPTNRRSEIITQFNENPDITIFLLTSRVGGLGLNLVGASRIIIYDPDWNPSTDNQAKERIWRYGQKKDVEIYRLICRNTIEEKIYKRQIFKNAISSKILRDASLCSTVEKSTLEELFDFKIEKDTKIENNFCENNLSEEIPKLDFVKEIDKEDVDRMSELMKKKEMTGRDVIEYILLREKQLKKKL